MDAAESQQLFKQADSLYRQGQYEHALQVLEKLNSTFPKQKNILFPAALCCEKLGRKRVALQVCEQIIELFNDPKALQMRARLTAPAEPPPVPGLPTMDILGLDPYGSAGRPAPRAAQAPGLSWKLILGICGGALAALVLILVLPMLFDGSEQPITPDPYDDVVVDSGTASGPAVALILLASFAVSTLVLYSVLSFMRKLPHDDFVSDVVDITLWNFIICVVSMIPFIGFIIGLVVLAKHYDLSCGELFMCVMLQIAVTFGLMFVLAMFFGGLAGLFGVA